MWAEAERREVFTAFESSVGTRVATLLTHGFPPLEWESLARRSDLDGLARRDELMAVRAELKAEVADLRTELKGELAEIRGELRGLPARMYTANVALALTVGGFVLAATKLG
jgi:hypothetical protein